MYQSFDRVIIFQSRRWVSNTSAVNFESHQAKNFNQAHSIQLPALNQTNLAGSGFYILLKGQKVLFHAVDHILNVLKLIIKQVKLEINNF